MLSTRVERQLATDRPASYYLVRQRNKGAKSAILLVSRGPRGLQTPCPAASPSIIIGV